MVYLLLLFLITPGIVLASPAEERDESDSVAILDFTRNFLGTSINALSNRVDSFFATERADDELGRSSIRVRQDYVIRERSLPDEHRRYRINLRLPHLEEKFRFHYFKDQKDKKPAPRKTARSTSDSNQIKRGWTFNADAGVNISIPPRLVLRSRLRRNFEMGDYVHRFSEEVTYVTNEDGLTEETTLQSDKRMTDTVLFRFVNSKRWRVLRKEFLTTHGPTFIQQLTEDDGLSYNFLFFNVINNGSFYLNNYSLSVNYRRNLYQNWLYLDIIPGIDFPKQWSFRRTPFAIFQLELLFGG